MQTRLGDMTIKHLVVLLAILGAIAFGIVSKVNADRGLAQANRAADCSLHYLNAPVTFERACEQGTLPSH